MRKRSLVRAQETGGRRARRLIAPKDAEREGQIEQQVSAALVNDQTDTRTFVQVKLWTKHPGSGSRWTEILFDGDHNIVGLTVSYTERDAWEQLQRQAAQKGIQL